MADSNDPAAPRPTVRRYIGTFSWDARDQTLLSSAATLNDCLAQLRQRADVFEHWYIRGEEGSAPLGDEPVERLTRELEANRRTWELHDVQYSGHHATVSNLRRKALRCEFVLTAGITVPSTSIWFANQVGFELCGSSSGFPDVASVEWLVTLLAADFVPAWGSVVTPHQKERELGEIYGGVPQVGWFTLFGPEYGTPPASKDYVVTTLPNGSHLVRLGDDWFDERNPEHVERRDRAEATLREAGLLRRRL